MARRAAAFRGLAHGDHRRRTEVAIEVARTIASAVSPSAGPIQWQVVVTLEIPWGRNLTHDVDIVVTR